MFLRFTEMQCNFALFLKEIYFKLTNNFSKELTLAFTNKPYLDGQP